MGILILIGVVVAIFVGIGISQDEKVQRDKRAGITTYREPVRMSGPVIPLKPRVRRGSVEWCRQESKLVKGYKEYAGKTPVTNKGASKLEWFITDWGKKSIPSPAEQLIINELGKYKIRWEREVSFTALPTANKGHYRFDFYLLDYSTILEYDSEIWHKSEEAKGHDKIKDKFCKAYNIQMIRYTKADYYKMHFRIEELMNTLKVKLR